MVILHMKGKTEMINNKPFAMFFNASPRKGWNTHKMLEAAKAGAEEAGAVTELVNLYDIKFPGCRSCFACKLKDAKTNGVCAQRDDLSPILERAPGGRPCSRFADLLRLSDRRLPRLSGKAGVPRVLVPLRERTAPRVP